MSWSSAAARVAISTLLLVGCTTDVNTNAPFGTSGSQMTSISAGDSGDSGDDATAGDDVDTNAATSDATTSGATSDASAGDTTSSGDPCVPSPCDPGEVCVDGNCMVSNAPAAGDVIFTELMPNPAAVTDAEGEWIELLNVGDSAVDIEGCVLVDDGAGPESDTINSGGPIFIEPGARVVLAKVVGPLINGGVDDAVYAFGDAFSLTNDGGDELALECDGVTIDEVVYTTAFGFGSGVAMELAAGSLDAAANDIDANWCSATAAYGDGDLGTPGLPNTGC
jgi:hypothetical protein